MAEPLRAEPDPSQAAPLRVVTAASLFDGHDAAINIMRRLLQAQGAEVIHLGHDRSVDEICAAALQEDAHAVAISSYQGGHLEFFRYLLDRLRESGAGDTLVFGGGGGTIPPEEAAELEAYGIARIFGVEDGRRLGLEGMIRALLERCRERGERPAGDDSALLSPAHPAAVARLISRLEREGSGGGARSAELRQKLAARVRRRAPVVGFTGTGGAGKSSVLDEFVRRYRLRFPQHSIGLLLVDPTRRRSGGALLGDRLRMNAIYAPRVFARSLATRQAHRALSQSVRDALLVLQAASYDLLLVETAGIGQADSEIVDLVDHSVYVMTPDYGAASQLEKIEMLDQADLVVLNKFDRRGAPDALRDLRRQWRRNRGGAELSDALLPIYPTIARLWNDPRTDHFCDALIARLEGREPAAARDEPPARALLPASRSRYLAEIAESIRAYRARGEAQVQAASRAQGLSLALETLGVRADAPVEAQPGGDRALLRAAYQAALAELEPALRRELSGWEELQARYAAPVQDYLVRGQRVRVENRSQTLAGTALPKVALPRGGDWGARARFLAFENRPGAFPFTAGVFPFQREAEDPTRMFAGEGTPERTNRRFHLVSRGQSAVRLSTAFDSVTLYGRDPAERPDIFGKVGNSGVSVCTRDDAVLLYSGFDLAQPSTSVSLTINGPAPTLLAFFLNAAIDQGVEKHLRETGRLDAVQLELSQSERPAYAGPLPDGHDGLGLALLGVSGDAVVDAETYARIRSDVLSRVRGTVQADILKEDQAQNTCIFSTEFSLQVMGDIQQYFVDHGVRNFYSVSVSGYHMAEAGANPITRLAFTLANGFTLLEAYRARGMPVDQVAPNFSFFFSNGLDAEYAVIGRVARRIWAIALREVYAAEERSQKLKYHIQTSGRSLHAQEMSFNDIRTTLQAWMALQDQCNSLHTNAYDEAVTTPTEESVRRALAIQLILQRELGIAANQNVLQGSHFLEWLTDEVEAAVLAEFERLSERGGVLGAMETGYQRGRIQDESLLYESRKHSGALPIIGVNTFQNPHPQPEPRGAALIRSSDAEKRAQIEKLRRFQLRHAEAAGPALAGLQRVARSGANVFAELMQTVKFASLQQITEALFEVGGRYRRSM